MSPMSKHVRFDCHVFTPGVPHDLSEDCWCEPSKNYWVPDKDGKLLHVLEHNDTLGAEAHSTFVDGVLNGLGR